MGIWMRALVGGLEVGGGRCGDLDGGLSGRLDGGLGEGLDGGLNMTLDGGLDMAWVGDWAVSVMQRPHSPMTWHGDSAHRCSSNSNVSSVRSSHSDTLIIISAIFLTNISSLPNAYGACNSQYGVGASLFYPLLHHIRHVWSVFIFF